MKALLLLLLTPLAIAQSAQLFTVQNPDKSYSEIEAVKAYWYSVDVVRTEYHIADKLSPTFTLVLGSDREGVMFDEKEIHLKQWSRPMFEQGVIYLTLAMLATPQNVMRLTKQIEAQQNAKVDLKDLKK